MLYYCYIFHLPCFTMLRCSLEKFDILSPYYVILYYVVLLESTLEQFLGTWEKYLIRAILPLLISKRSRFTYKSRTPINLRQTSFKYRAIGQVTRPLCSRGYLIFGEIFTHSVRSRPVDGRKCRYLFPARGTQARCPPPPFCRILLFPLAFYRFWRVASRRENHFTFVPDITSQYVRPLRPFRHRYCGEIIRRAEDYKEKALIKKRKTFTSIRKRNVCENESAVAVRKKVHKTLKTNKTNSKEDIEGIDGKQHVRTKDE